MKRIFAIGLACALVIGACSVNIADNGGPLVIYSGRSEELVQPVIDRFIEATGIGVEVRYAESPELAAILIAEGDATDADVFFAQDPATLGSVVDQLDRLPEDVLAAVDKRFRDRDGRWIGISGRVRTFVYDTRAGLDLPQTIDDVVDSRWSGRLGVAPTNGSFLAFVSAMILERGEERTAEWLAALAAIEPVDFPANSPIVAAVDDGEIEAGLVNHYYLLRLRAEGAGDNAENWFIPAGDVGSLVMPAGAGILANSDQPEAARKFIEFLLSTETQTFFATETFEFPLVGEVDAPNGLPLLSEIRAPDIDLSQLASVLATATRLVAEAGLV